MYPTHIQTLHDKFLSKIGSIYNYMIYFFFWQLRTVALWVTQAMAGLVILLEQHMESVPPMAVIQATTEWGPALALVNPQECGLGVHLHVHVCCYYMHACERWGKGGGADILILSIHLCRLEGDSLLVYLLCKEWDSLLSCHSTEKVQQKWFHVLQSLLTEWCRLANKSS